MDGIRNGKNEQGKMDRRLVRYNVFLPVRGRDADLFQGTMAAGRGYCGFPGNAARAGVLD